MTAPRLGKIGAATTGVSVAAFALAMLVALASGLSTAFISYLASMFIAVGYVIFAAALFSQSLGTPNVATGATGLAFSVVYAVFVFIVYYAMLTTVRMNTGLSDEAMAIISYERLGSLFFNYDLLGYGFMGLSTFFLGFTIAPQDKGDRTLRILLWIHGVFFLTCFIMPLFPLFTPDMEGGEVIGTLVLLVWCAYFLPVCVLGWRYFQGALSHSLSKKAIAQGKANAE